MDIFSPNFLLLFLVAILVITLRARSKKKGTAVLPGKQIAIIGRKLETPLGVDIPYLCLMEDGRKFGDGFRDKQEPELPHSDACQCQFSSFVQRNYDIFTKNPPLDPPRISDLGELARSEARYYKYTLIANHPDATDEDRKSYIDLAEQVEVDAEFCQKVKQHLKLS